MAVISGGHISDKYMDRDVYFRSFRVYAPGKKINEIYQGLTYFVEGIHVSNIGKVDSNTFEVTIPDSEAFYMLQEAGSIRVGDRDYKLRRTSEQRLEIKCHWLPDYLSDDFLVEWFGRFGTVQGVARDTQSVTGETRNIVRNGVRTVTITVGEMYKSYIPHLVKFDAGITMLITYQGREPLCLKCHEVGHMRRECLARRSYAQATVNTPAPERKSHQDFQVASPSAHQRPAPADATATPATLTPDSDTQAPTPVPATPISAPITQQSAPSPPLQDGAGESQPTPGQRPGYGDRDDDDDFDKIMDTLMGTVSNDKRPHDDDTDETKMTHVIKKGRSVPIS